jgi:hypothetical protein
MSSSRHAHVIVMWFPQQLLNNCIESYQQWGLPHTTYQALGPPPFSSPVCGGPPLFLPMRALNRNVIFLPCACDRDVVSSAIAQQLHGKLSTVGLPHTTYEALGAPPFSSPMCGGPPLFLPMRASNRNVIASPCACDRDVVSFAIA